MASTTISEDIDKNPCRDCGYLLHPGARGCPRCAMNVEAERMIERFVWRWLFPGLVVVVVLGIAGLIWLLR
jgi:hypothetical protein